MRLLKCKDSSKWGENPCQIVHLGFYYSMHPLFHGTIMINDNKTIMFIMIEKKIVHQGFYHSLCIPSFIEQDRVSGFWTWMFVLSKVMMMKHKCFYYYCKPWMLIVHALKPGARIRRYGVHRAKETATYLPSLVSLSKYSTINKTVI